MKEYNFYEALELVMEHGKQFYRDDVKMHRRNDVLCFSWILANSERLCSVQKVTNLDVGSVWYEYNATDWTKVEVDTKIWVRSLDGQDWIPAHFHKYVDGVVYGYDMGRTSHTSNGRSSIWTQFKLEE